MTLPFQMSTRHKGLRWTEKVDPVHQTHQSVFPISQPPVNSLSVSEMEHIEDPSTQLKLDKKRSRDRTAQRLWRYKTRGQIANLGREIAELEKFKTDYGQLEEQNRQLSQQLEDLKSRTDHWPSIAKSASQSKTIGNTDWAGSLPNRAEESDPKNSEEGTNQPFNCEPREIYLGFDMLQGQQQNFMEAIDGSPILSSDGSSQTLQSNAVCAPDEMFCPSYYTTDQQLESQNQHSLGSQNGVGLHSITQMDPTPAQQLAETHSFDLSSYGSLQWNGAGINYEQESYAGFVIPHDSIHLMSSS